MYDNNYFTKQLYDKTISYDMTISSKKGLLHKAIIPKNGNLIKQLFSEIKVNSGKVFTELPGKSII